MRLHSYVVARDYGFAPNPFFGVCTLATCKPIIRSVAAIGDWVMGTGSKQWNREHHVVYAMRVTESMTFEQYWNDPRFQKKKPNLRGSKKQAFGDNIYFRNAKAEVRSYRIGEIARLSAEVEAWKQQANRQAVQIQWKFDRAKAREKFRYSPLITRSEN